MTNASPDAFRAETRAWLEANCPPSMRTPMSAEDEATWDRLDVMFATRSGNVRRNKLSDFVQINRNVKIAMKWARARGAARR